MLKLFRNVIIMLSRFLTDVYNVIEIFIAAKSYYSISDCQYILRKRLTCDLLTLEDWGLLVLGVFLN